MPIPVTVHLQRSEPCSEQFSEKTAEDLLFNKSLPLSSYKKSTFTLNGKSSVAEVMQTAIGQGNTLVSPMHMALITSAIANGGELMKPYLIDSVVSSDGETVKTTEPESYKRLMTTNEANILGKLMKGVVENGTASALNGRGYTVQARPDQRNLMRMVPVIPGLSVIPTWMIRIW